MGCAMPTIFFTDLDGTLEDSRLDMANAAIAARTHLGLQSEVNDFYIPFVNKGMRELTLHCFSEMFEALEGTALEKKLAHIQMIYEQFYFEKIAVHTQLYAGIKSVLQRFAQIGKVVVITNKPHYLSVEHLSELGIMPFVSLVMGGDSCSETKPSPLPLQIAGQKLGFHKGSDKAFMMGDTVADIKCGQSFGAQTIWCKYGYSESIGELKPDFEANSPAEILDFVLNQ